MKPRAQYNASSTLVAVCAGILTFVSAGFVTAAQATDVKIGGIGIVTPKYEGSESYRVIGVPFAYPVFSSGPSGSFSINGADDVRIRLLNERGFEAGLLGGYTFGRDQDDGDLLLGLGDVDDGFIAGAFAGYRFGTTLFDVSYHRIVSGNDTGGYLRIGVQNVYHVSSQVKLKARVGTTYADADYMAEYFGVSQAQALTSRAGLASYETDAGFKDVHLNLSGVYDIDSRWSLMAGAGYKRLLGDAADSPVVETADQFSATFGLTYRFSLR